MAQQIIDGLLVVNVKDNGEEKVAAKLVYDGGTYEWINDGDVIRDRITIVDAGHSLKVDFDANGIEEYRRRRDEGDEKAHHVIVARGEVDGHRVVGFPAKNGRIGLKPAASTGTAKGFDRLL